MMDKGFDQDGPYRVQGEAMPHRYYPCGCYTNNVLHHAECHYESVKLSGESWPVVKIPFCCRADPHNCIYVDKTIKSFPYNGWIIKINDTQLLHIGHMRGYSLFEQNKFKGLVRQEIAKQFLGAWVKTTIGCELKTNPFIEAHNTRTIDQLASEAMQAKLQTAYNKAVDTIRTVRINKEKDMSPDKLFSEDDLSIRLNGRLQTICRDFNNGKSVSDTLTSLAKDVKAYETARENVQFYTKLNSYLNEIQSVLSAYQQSTGMIQDVADKITFVKDEIKRTQNLCKQLMSPTIPF